MRAEPHRPRRASLAPGRCAGDGDRRVRRDLARARRRLLPAARRLGDARDGRAAGVSRRPARDRRDGRARPESAQRHDRRRHPLDPELRAIDPRDGALAEGARVRAERPGARCRSRPRAARSHPAEQRVAPPRVLVHADRHGNPARRDPVVPRARRAAADARVGKDGERRPRPPPRSAARLAVSRSRDLPHRDGLQLSRRRAARRARPAPAHAGGRMNRDDSYGWVIVLAAVGIVGFGVGAMFSLGVFLKPMQESMGWSRGAISGVALSMWITYGMGSLMWGMLAERLGARRVVVAGGFLVGLGLVVASRIASLWQLYAAFGGLVGVAAGAFYAPLTTTATRWFTANRGLAVALVSAGTGLGTFVVAPLTRWLISTWDWRVAMLVLGDIVWLVIIPLGLLIREAPGRAAANAEPSVPLAQVGRSPQFWLIALTHFTC